MPSDYTGNPAGITAREVPVISCPVGTDAPVAASVNTPLEKLADFVAVLMRDAALFAVENGFTVEQAFLAASALLLSRSGPQTITKIGSGDLLITNTVGGVAALAASGGSVNLASSGGASLDVGPSQIGVNKPLAMGANAITGVADPTNPQDAATKAYVNAQDAAIVGALAPVAVRSSSSGTYVLTTTNSLITAQSVSIATGGRSVVVALQPDEGGANPTCVRLIAGAQGQVHLRRDGDEIAKWIFNNPAADDLQAGLPPPFVDLDASSGTHVYEFFAYGSNIGTGSNIEFVKTVAYLL